MQISEFFQSHRKVALAYSGGTDSSYLLYAANSFGCDVQAYFVNSAFQPQFELDEAQRVADDLDLNIKLLNIDILSNNSITDNPVNRCYYCKHAVFSLIKNEAKKDGYVVVIDGTNASDNIDDRPGMKALHELGILSPLRACGVTKAKVYELSKATNLLTKDKPSYACLATRIPYETKITEEVLLKVEKSEDFIRSIGFSDFRVRVMAGSCKLQIKENQFQLLLKNRAKLVKELKIYFNDVLLDLNPR